MKITDRLSKARERLNYVQSADYLLLLEGTLGADSLGLKVKGNR